MDRNPVMEAKIVEYFTNNPGKAISACAEVMKVEQKDIRPLLFFLRDKGDIKVLGTKKGAKYYVNLLPLDLIVEHNAKMAKKSQPVVLQEVTSIGSEGATVTQVPVAQEVTTPSAPVDLEGSFGSNAVAMDI